MHREMSMRNTTELMVQYAAYHRDRRNIATHFVGIPLIVFSIGVLLARPEVAVAGLMLTPAWIVWAAATLWYLSRGNLGLAFAVSAANGALIALAQPVGDLATSTWLTWGIGCFVLGWIAQFVGHRYEGRKPAFFDDVAGLLIGPLFVTAEALFALGWGKPLLAEIERRTGPTILRDLHHPATR
jgi:uncharacterized membrane protein YGL010W